MRYTARAFTGALLLSVVGGCSSQVGVTESEITAKNDVYKDFRVSSNATYNQLIEYGNNLATQYLKRAEKTSTNQDIAFFSLLGLTLLSTNRAIEGANAVEQAKYAAGILGANEAASYVSPGTATQALIRAAIRANCVASLAASFKGDFIGDPTGEFAGVEDPLGSFREQAKTSMVVTYETIRISLRKDLARELPDFSDIADRLENAIKEDEKNQDEVENLIAQGARENKSLALRQKAALADVKKRLSKFKVDLAKCPTRQ
ncbi:MAG: hypothetical protein QNJ16_18095 [Rhodobacter sp.]|nr:hypothetical protein [Rhodobacter sp.]